MRRGLFIVFEGVEGAGKSTQASLLGRWLQRAGVPHVLTFEPGGTAVGEQIRQVLLHHRGDVPVRAELLLFLAARAALVERVIRPALGAGQVVVSDRYELSSLAYQGYGRGIAVDEVRRLNAFATGGLRPDLVLLLEISAELGGARRAAAGLAADRIEQESQDFHARVAEAYGLLADQDPVAERVDGGGAPEQVHAEVIRRLRARFPETFLSPAG